MSPSSQEPTRLQSEADISVVLGDIHLYANDLDEAERIFEQDLHVRQANSDRIGEGAAVSRLGQVALKRGQIDKAERLFRQSLVIRQEVSDRQGESADLSYLGDIAQ